MNINEIARLAGVSRATVSRYLNNGYVSEEKKAVIRRVIEETGYQPSSQAQMLRTKKTRLVGVILPKINSNTISREAAGISDILTKKGYQIVLANTNNDFAVKSHVKSDADSVSASTCASVRLLYVMIFCSTDSGSSK